MLIFKRVQDVIYIYMHTKWKWMWKLFSQSSHKSQIKPIARSKLIKNSLKQSFQITVNLYKKFEALSHVKASGMTEMPKSVGQYVHIWLFQQGKVCLSLKHSCAAKHDTVGNHRNGALVGRMQVQYSIGFWDFIKMKKDLDNQKCYSYTPLLFGKLIVFWYLWQRYEPNL